jgi:Zn-dependent protease with chaperone function
VHTLLLLLSVLLVGLGGSAVLRLVPGDAGRRRRLLLLVLGSPMVSLGVGLAGLVHFDRRLCFLGAPAWDRLLATAVPLAMGLVGLGAVGLGALRLGLLSWLVGRRSVPAGAELRALVDGLSLRAGVPAPRVRVYASSRPVALTCGVWQPTLVLSTWMLHALDARELESVVAHELGHAVRRDAVVLWLASVLRDAFPYLATVHRAYRQLLADKEAACDDLAVAVTGRPLALASALAKVWSRALGDPGAGAAPALAGPGCQVEERICRLLHRPRGGEAVVPPPASAMSAVLGASVLVGLLVGQVLGVAVMFLDPVACGPTSPLWRAL